MSINISKEELILAVTNAKSKADVLRNLGYDPHRKYYPTLDAIAKKYKIILPSSSTGSSNLLRSIDDSIILELVNTCASKKEILFCLGFSDTAQMYKVLNEILEKLCVLKFEKNKKGIDSKTYVSVTKYLTKDSTLGSSRLRIKLLEEKLIDNKCYICGILPVWNNKKLTLQLDHINGINTDNRLENIRLLCPNCHTQTDNYCSKNIKDSSA